MIKKSLFIAIFVFFVNFAPVNATTLNVDFDLAAVVLEPTELKKIDEGALQQAIGNWKNSPGLRQDATLVIMDASDGEVLYEENSHKLQTPASVTKLFTAVTVASLLDPDSQIITRVMLAEGTVYLVGAGDPQFGAATGDGPVNLEQLAEQAAITLKDFGLKSVKIAIDDSIFEPLQVPEDWLPGYLASSEAHPVTALNLDDPKAPRQAPKDPSLVTGEKFANFLRASGIRVTSRAERKSTPNFATEIAQMKSKSVAQLIEDTLYTSNNQDTEILARLAAKVAQDETDTRSTMNLIRTVNSSWGIDSEELALSDASGLSRTNAISAFVAADLSRLILLENEPIDLPLIKNNISVTNPPGTFKPDLWPVMTGLPPARSLGTMYKRLSDSKDVAKGVTRAKTGTLNQVIGLSGTIKTKDGGMVTFAVMANQANSRTSTRNSVDELMNSIANCECLLD